MSGHSKWHSIKHKKGAADAARGKLFTKHAKLIYIAAREGGPDPDMNAALRTAIANAKADNVPNANIDKAIKKASGTGKGAEILEEIMYEGFGPANSTFYVQVITNNRNRAVAAIKTAFTKSGGNMGEAGTVAWMFERKGLILAKLGDKNPEEAELEVVDAGAEDLTIEDGKFEIITQDVKLMEVKDKLEAAGFEIEKAELSYFPNNPVEISNEQDAQKVIKIIEMLEDEEDVSSVYTNVEISDEVMEKL
ncbi:YebC/PmpR family DNA-binding transcriptional regulator [Candidatus Peregrinibacteria bacterium]|nr:YebC/PmpR family DNA-binding transcriptional regulator [Candidatus Peregrinibacteria bacterium]